MQDFRQFICLFKRILVILLAKLNTMKTIYFYLFSPLFIILLCSCEGVGKFSSFGFEGEYVMRTTAYWENSDGSFEKELHDIISHVKIYVDNDNLYIRTNSFGMPNYGEYDTEEVESSYDPPYDTPNPLTNDDNGNSSAIEYVTTDANAVTTMIGGLVYVIRDGKFLKSLPIEALRVKEKEITFKNSQYFEVPLTNIDGTIIGVVKNHFEYSKAQLRGDTIFWNVDLRGEPSLHDSKPNQNNTIHVKYENKLVRR